MALSTLSSICIGLLLWSHPAIIESSSTGSMCMFEVASVVRLAPCLLVFLNNCLGLKWVTSVLVIPSCLSTRRFIARGSWMANSYEHNLVCQRHTSYVATDMCTYWCDVDGGLRHYCGTIFLNSIQFKCLFREMYNYNERPENKILQLYM